MKRFLIKTCVFVLLLFAAIYLYVLRLGDNEVDPYYYRFTTGKYKSLVLGTSRAAQGIEPGILNDVLGLSDNRIFNYSFAVDRSQWGEPYHNSIVKKLDTSKNADGVFILECNLWAFCSKRDELGNFKEKRILPNNVMIPTLDPNIQYFFGGFEDQNVALLLKKVRKTKKNRMYVNTDGRLDVKSSFDSIAILRNVKNKVKLYEGIAKEYLPDSARMLSFKKTIKYLKQFGSVYLIRMPVAEEILELESSFYPTFNNKMYFVSKECAVPYIDLTYLSDKYITSDGNHLHNDQIVPFNRLLASEILKAKEKNSEKLR